MVLGEGNSNMGIMKGRVSETDMQKSSGLKNKVVVSHQDSLSSGLIITRIEMRAVVLVAVMLCDCLTFIPWYEYGTENRSGHWGFASLDLLSTFTMG